MQPDTEFTNDSCIKSGSVVQMNHSLDFSTLMANNNKELLKNGRQMSKSANTIFEKLLSQFHGPEKLTETFIIEGILNDIDELTNKITRLNSQKL